MFDDELDNLQEDKEWGGNRKGAGRVSVIKRKYRSFYLSDEEEKIDKTVSDAFRKIESELKKALAKKLKCRQYDVEEAVYKKLLVLREKVAATATEMIEAEKKDIYSEILNEKQSSQ